MILIEGEKADFTSHRAQVTVLPITMDMIECNKADITMGNTEHRSQCHRITQSTGNSAIITMDMIECNKADITMDDMNNEDIDPIGRLVARINHLHLSKGSGHTTPKAASSKVEKRPWPTNWPVKRDMYAHIKITKERHNENMCLLLQEFCLKARHVARLTRNWEGGEIWPTVVEPAALELSETMNMYGIDWWNAKYRPDYLEELDFTWRSWPHSLRGSDGHKLIWEYITGMARTWDRDRRRGSVRFQNDQEDHHRQKSPGKDYHIVKNLRVPTIAQAIRKNKFIGVGDDETACVFARPSPLCQKRCAHKYVLAYLKKKASMATPPPPVAEDDCRLPYNHSATTTSIPDRPHA